MIRYDYRFGINSCLRLTGLGMDIRFEKSLASGPSSGVEKLADLLRCIGFRRMMVAGTGNLRQWGDGSVGRAREDGSPHSRGHGIAGEVWSWGTIDSSLRCAMFRMTWGECCAPNEIWVEGEDHPHPPSSRGQALTFPPQEGREKEGDGSPHSRGQRRRGELVVGDDRFFTPLRYVQNDMGGSAALRMTWGECCAPNDMGGVLRSE